MSEVTSTKSQWYDSFADQNVYTHEVRVPKGPPPVNKILGYTVDGWYAKYLDLEGQFLKLKNAKTAEQQPETINGLNVTAWKAEYDWMKKAYFASQKALADERAKAFTKSNQILGGDAEYWYKEWCKRDQNVSTARKDAEAKVRAEVKAIIDDAISLADKELVSEFGAKALGNYQTISAAVPGTYVTSEQANSAVDGAWLKARRSTWSAIRSRLRP